MEETKCKYDPAIYGPLTSVFLQNLDTTSSKFFDSNCQNNEKMRRQVLKDIEEGRLVAVKKE